MTRTQNELDRLHVLSQQIPHKCVYRSNLVCRRERLLQLRSVSEADSERRLKAPQDGLSARRKEAHSDRTDTVH